MSSGDYCLDRVTLKTRYLKSRLTKNTRKPKRKLTLSEDRSTASIVVKQIKTIALTIEQQKAIEEIQNEIDAITLNLPDEELILKWLMCEEERSVLRKRSAIDVFIEETREIHEQKVIELNVDVEVLKAKQEILFEKIFK